MKIKKGTVITLTKGWTDWALEMDKFVGEQAVVTSVTSTGNIRTLQCDVPNINNFSWTQENGHYVRGRQKVNKPLIMSGTFKQFLKEISDRSKVARMMITVMRWRDNFDTCGYLVDKVITTSEVNFLTMRGDGMLSFMPSSKKQTYTDNGEWSREGRQSGKPSRVIRKIFTEKALKMFKEADFELFNNAYNAKFRTDNYVFNLLPSSEIPTVYDMPYLEGGAGLESSCMRGHGEYMDLYKNCGDLLKILTLVTSNGELAGRSLIWTGSDVGNGELITFMDRIYVASDEFYERFLEYAKKQGWYHKKYYRNRDNPSHFMTPSGEMIQHNLKVKVDQDCDTWPYIDSFQWGDGNYLYNNPDYCVEYQYDSTTGGRSRKEEEEECDNSWYDGIDEETRGEDEQSYTIDAGSRRYRGQFTIEDNIVQIDGDTYYKEDTDYIVYCSFYNCYLLREDVVYCEEDGTYYKIDDVVEVCEESSKEGYFLTSECYEVNGNYYHESEVTKL